MTPGQLLITPHNTLTHTATLPPPTMRALVAIHALTLCLLMAVANSPVSYAFGVALFDLPRLPQLPFLATVQSLIASQKPFIPHRSTLSRKRMTQRTVFHQGTHEYRGLSARYDFPASDSDLHGWQDGDATAMKTTRVKTWRPKDTTAFLDAHRQGDDVGVRKASRAMDWDEIEVDAPDVTDRETLLTLSKMASKAYDAPKNGFGSDWVTGGGKWNLSESFGWVEDGIRGHIFATDDNATIVVALKGTSAALLDDGSTSKRDKENVSNDKDKGCRSLCAAAHVVRPQDNLLFSCCCAHVGWTWHTVCDCFSDKAKGSSSVSNSLDTLDNSGQTCASTCLTKALITKSFYYPATTDLFNNISYAYPDSQIWITGHSLGGSLGALIGMTFGYPTVTFEAPAERMAAVRLHLPLPVKHEDMDALPITHVYHTADPIPNGECIGATSLCANFGFAMESRCHSGKTVLYDTVGKLGWASSVVTHRIITLTDDLLTEDWDKKVEKAKGKGRTVETASWLRRWRLPWSKTGDDKGSDQSKKLGAVPALRSEKKCRGE